VVSDGHMEISPVDALDVVAAVARDAVRGAEMRSSWRLCLSGEELVE
jgi:hypothetical protein